MQPCKSCGLTCEKRRVDHVELGYDAHAKRNRESSFKYDFFCIENRRPSSHTYQVIFFHTGGNFKQEEDSAAIFITVDLKKIACLVWQAIDCCTP
jgi:Fe-S-cluster containining protein